jgi:hypothetical protein
VARDLLLYDPPRVLAWRALHDPRLSGLPAALAPFMPGRDFDRDPIALCMGAVALGLALGYLFAALWRASNRLRAGLIAAASVALVVIPTLGFIALGSATDRPYGQDGGVVQLPLALDRVVAGRSPYGADYSDSILGKESRVSDFWALHGGNPILHHHAYLPGTHLLMLPGYLLARVLGWRFDPRFVTLLAYGLGALCVGRLVAQPERRLVAVAVVLLNPFAYWLQVFGANDILAVTLLLAALLVGRKRPLWAAALLGLACATKQLAWPFAPFVLLHLSGLRTLRDLRGGDGRRCLRLVSTVALLVFAAVVLPLAALDPRAFWGDIVVYNVGLPGADNYPLGGTPGFGFANVLVYFAMVKSLKDYVPLAASYLILLPIGLLLLRRQLKEGTEAAALLSGSAALLASLYLSRVVHPNYLILAAILIPIAGLLDRRVPADVIVLPLLLLGWAVEIVEHELFRATWEDALGVRLPLHWGSLGALLGPRAGPALSLDPLGLGLSALAAGLGTAYLIGGVLGGTRAFRGTLLALSALVLVLVPTLIVTGVGEVSGQPRGEAGFLAQVARAAPWSPEPPREAWSLSFRRDPPRPLESPENPLGAGVSALGWLLGLARRDPRVLALVSAAVAAALVFGGSSKDDRLVLLGVALVSPPAALGVAFGSADALVLAGVLTALALLGTARREVGSLVLGGLAAIVPRTLWAAPFALRMPREGEGWRALGFLGGYAAVAGAGALLRPVPLGIGGLLPPSGIGLPNLFPLEGSAPRSAVFVLLLIGTLAAAWMGAERCETPLSRLLGMGVALLLGLFVAPAASAMDLALPLVLLVLSARRPVMKA